MKFANILKEQQKSKKVVNEGLSPQAIQRMNGLVFTNDLKKLQVAAESIFNTLSDDGFENDDIDAYILIQIKKVGIRS